MKKKKKRVITKTFLKWVSDDMLMDMFKKKRPTLAEEKIIAMYGVENQLRDFLECFKHFRKDAEWWLIENRKTNRLLICAEMMEDGETFHYCNIVRAVKEGLDFFVELAIRNTDVSVKVEEYVIKYADIRHLKWFSDFNSQKATSLLVDRLQAVDKENKRLKNK